MLWEWSSLLIRSGLILAAAELLRQFARKSTAVYRHRILLAAFILLLSWPLLSALLPEVPLSLWRANPVLSSVTLRQTFTLPDRTLKTEHTVKWPVLMWLAGVVLVLSRLLQGYWNVRKLARRATPLMDKAWQDLLTQACTEVALQRKPELLILPDRVIPFTFGLRHPRILLPAECVDWKTVRGRAVLLHEVAHLGRRDLLWQLLANLATALWWFQPMCWWSRSQLRRESERACDALVIETGIRPSEYAGELLAIVKSFAVITTSSGVAISMGGPGELQGRLYAILESPAQGIAKRPLAATVFLTALTLTASAVTISPERTHIPGGNPMKRTLIGSLLASAGLSAAASIGGSVFDPTGAAIPNAHASLYNPDNSNTQETTTGSDGKFAFASLSAGSYILHVEKPGFASLYREFNVEANSDVQRGLTLTTGSNPNAASPEDQPASQKLIRVRGTNAQGNLLRKVQPVYPVAAKTAHVQGKVELDAIISKEGVPEDLRVVSSPSDDLTQSALESVRQWRYRPTLLNGQPVPVVTDILVNYTLLE